MYVSDRLGALAASTDAAPTLREHVISTLMAKCPLHVLRDTAYQEMQSAKAHSLWTFVPIKIL